MTDRREIFDRVLRLEPGHTALVVVDMQRGFLEPGAALEVPPAREIVPVIRRLLDLFRAQRLPVVPEIQRATLDIVGRAYGRVVSSKEVVDEVSPW